MPTASRSRSSRPRPRSAPLEVWKFGGASLADGKAIDRAAASIAAHEGPLVVVASALAGITDLLLEGAAHAAPGRRPRPRPQAAAELASGTATVVTGAAAGGAARAAPPGRARRRRHASIATSAAR